MALKDRIGDICQRVLGNHIQAPELSVEEVNPLSKLKLRVGKCTSIGNYRDNNEDRLYVDEDCNIFVVADGMGGQAAGEQASQLAVDMIPQQLVSLDETVTDAQLIRETLSDAVKAANEAIIAQGIADPSVQNMGTTVVLAVLRGGCMYVAHLGDSPAFLLRGDEIRILTTDHNLAQALFDAGTITKDELKTHRFRHVLWKYLGSKEATDGPDIGVFDIRAGDRIVLASDGLTGVVEDEAILKEANSFDDPQRSADHLVNLALES